MLRTAYLITLTIPFATFLIACPDRAEPTTPAPDAGPSPDTGTSADPDGGSDSPTYLALCHQPEAYCARLYACARPERLAMDQTFFMHTDEASCVRAIDDVLGGICRATQMSIEAGRMAVDLPALIACSDFLRTLSCSEQVHGDPRAHPVCGDLPFLTGLVTTGGECAADGECADASQTCVGAAETTLGTCQPRTPGDCLDDRDCTLDEYCNQPGNDWRASTDTPGARGICTARGAPGDACDDLNACADPAHCDNDGGYDPDGWRNPGHCALPRPPGEVCNEPADCESRNCGPDDLCR
jgi:hypothetical protein